VYLCESESEQESEKGGRVGEERLAKTNTLQYTATHCNTLQHAATHWQSWERRDSSTLQHTATHCITLQHIADLGREETETEKHTETSMEEQ